jgi:hypothetical protein
MDIKEIEWDGVKWLNWLGNEDTDEWQALVNIVLNHCVPYNMVISWPAEKLSASQEGLCSTKLVS